MPQHFDEKWLREYCERTNQRLPDLGTNPSRDYPSSPARNNKYNAQKAYADGMTFDSKHEAECYRQFKLLVRAGDYHAVFCQVPFALPGEIKYIADFVTLNRDGTFTVWDAKSEATAKDKTFRIKKKLMKSCLNIDVKEIFNG